MKPACSRLLSWLWHPGGLLLGVVLLTLLPWWSSPGALPYSRSSDLFRHYLPFKEALYRLSAGGTQLPGWNPYVLAGQPLLADPGSGALYPLGVLFYILPPSTQFAGFFGVHILLGVLLAYALARSLGTSRSAGAVAALAYGLNLKLVGTWYAGFATMIPAQSWLPGAFWGLVLLRQADSRGPWLKGALLLGGALAMQLLAGDAQLMLYTALGVGLVGLLVPLAPSPLVRLEKPGGRTQLRFLLGLLLAGGVTLLLASPLLLPASALTRASVRAEGVSPAVAMQMNVPPAHLPALVVPAFSGSDAAQTWRGPDAFWETAFGPGLLVWLLALLALGRGAEDLRLKRLWACAGLVLLASFGADGPLYPLLYYTVPGMDHFRGPARVLPLLALLLGWLAALELDARSRSPQAARRLLHWTGGLALLWSGLLGWLWVQRTIIPASLEQHIRGALSLEGAGHRAWQELSMGLGLQLLVLGLLAMGLRVALSTGLSHHGWSAARLRRGVLVLVGLELSLQGLPHLDARADAEWLPPHPLAEELARELNRSGLTPDKSESGQVVPERILDLSGALPDAVAVRYGLQLVNGLNPLVLARSYTFLQYVQGEKPELPTDRPLYGLLVFGLKHPALLDLLRVRTVVSEQPLTLPGFELSSPGGPVEVFQQFRGMAQYARLERLQRQGPLPLAWLVSRWSPAPTDAATRLDWLSRLDLFESVLVETPPWESRVQELPTPPTPLEQLALRSPGAQAPVGILHRRWSPDRIALEAEVPAGGAFLVLSEVLTPGWQVWVDGRRRSPWLAQHLLRAVWLEVGRHEVVWQYQPWGLTTAF